MGLRCQFLSFDTKAAVNFGCLILFAWAGLSSLRADGELQDNLSSHVRYLSQPKLHGRKTRSSGAELARRYIQKEFKNSGLLTWNGTKKYELSFGLGKNVVGIVPGSDTNMAREIVLLSAHYDHLGKDGKGRMCPGATDNASGVAVLLEAARRFASAEHRSRRTMAFAAFDAEEQMLLGSFAFSCRADVATAKIVAVVNVDMLGRDFFDAISNTVFVAGTETYPGLQTRVHQFGTEAEIRVLPIGSDLIGPRSDHVAFESRKVPCLFFSCGVFKDYHAPGDTAEKLNYDNLRKSAQVIFETAEALANADSSPESVSSESDPHELKSMHTVVSELCRDPRRAGIKEKDVGALTNLNARLERLVATGSYSRRIREELIFEVTRSLGQYFLPFGDRGSENQDKAWSEVIPYLEHIYLNYRVELLEGQRQLVRQLLEHPPALLRGVPEFRYEIYDIPTEDIWLGRARGDNLALHALGNNFSLSVRCRPLIWPFGAFQAGFSGSFEALDCEGTREQLIDYCLLFAHPQRTNQLHTAAIGKIIRRVAGHDVGGDYEQWLQARLQAGDYSSKTDWLADCLTGSNPQVLHEAITTVQEFNNASLRRAVLEIIGDNQVRPDVRAHAIQSAARHPDKNTLLSFVEVLGDTNVVYRREYCPQLSPEYPLSDRMTFLTLKPFLENTFAQPQSTIGQTALENLRRATKRNFGSDRGAWKALVEKWR